MIITKLTSEHLRYFIFLMDGIASREEDFIEVGRIFKELQQQEIEVSWHSINRAFELRRVLKMDVMPKKKVVLPKKKTLDALTKYYYGRRFVFRDLVCTEPDILVNEAEVQEHYKVQRPTKTVIDQLFKKQPEKIEFIADQKETYQECLSEVKNRYIEVLEEFKETKERSSKLERILNENINFQKDMILHLEKRIEELENKLERVLRIHGKFGAIGLFLVSIDFRELSNNIIIEDFVGNYEIHGDIDFLDDFH